MTNTGEMRDLYVSKGAIYKDRGEEFDAWLSRVKAAVWEEGYRNAVHDFSGFEHSLKKGNPYL